MTQDDQTQQAAGTEADSAIPAMPDPAARRRRRRLIGAAVVGGVLVAGLATLVLLWTQRSTRPVTVEEARERADLTGPDGDPSASATPFRPAVGIYRYRGEGTEQLDKPPTSQRQGPEIPGTLTHLDDGCWRLRVDYNTEHWQSWDYCSTGDGLTENAGAFFQRLDLVVTQVETSSSYTCEPPVDAIRAEQQAGDQWMQECRGTSTGTDGEVISTGPYTYLGTETLDIGGDEVEALHYRRSRTLTGGQSGTEDIDVWFDAATGLILQNERDITVRSDSLIGGVTYEERGSFVLVSMSPSR